MKKITKTLLIIGVLLLTFSCSKDDDSSLSSFNPPSWIIGTWLDKTEPEWTQVGGFKFTNDNIIDLNAEGVEILNYKVGLQSAIDIGITTIEEIITSNSYEIRITTNGLTNLIYKFSKGATNTIVYKLTPSIEIILTKQ
ncbi:hypothetical protein [Lutibacter profundi]|nr:hypothetical protein [Lutibacter profundi]